MLQRKIIYSSLPLPRIELKKMALPETAKLRPKEALLSEKALRDWNRLVKRLYSLFCCRFLKKRMNFNLTGLWASDETS